MNEVLIGATSILVFALFFVRSGIPELVRRGMDYVRDSAALIVDRELDDEEKERRVRKAAVGMFAILGSLLVRIAAVMAASFAPVLMGRWIGVTSIATMTEWFISPAGLFVAFIGFALFYAISSGSKRRA